MPLSPNTQEPPTGSDGPLADVVRFCSRCGRHAHEVPGRPELRRRVCVHCGMGVVLTSSGDALPGAQAPFLIVASDLTVTAVSEAGEKVFGPEEDVVGAGLLDLLSSPLGDDQLERRARRAAQLRSETVALPVRLRPEQAPRMGTLSARIATCASPRAALVSVEPSGFGLR